MEGRLLVRKIRACSSIAQALALLDQEQQPGDTMDEVAVAEVLHLCSKHKDTDAALEIVQKVPHSEICRTRAISILGRCGRLSDALALLVVLQPRPATPAPYTSAIAACSHTKDWEAALLVLEDMPPALVTTLTLNAVLTVLQKAKRGNEALALLDRASSSSTQRPWSRVTLDRTSYHTTLSALLDQRQVHQACNLIRRMDAAANPSVRPTTETYNRLAAAVTGWPDQWAIVQAALPDKVGKELPPMFDFEKWKLPKMGRGKAAFWYLGTYTTADQDDLIVGLQPNRNPSVNGVKLAFYRPDEQQRLKRLGYLLMINQKQSGSSQFLGQFVNENSRGQGLAKLWLAVWLRICLEGGIRPCTGKIHKPLLCLVLEHNFGMIAQLGGVEAELSPGEKEGEVVLYSSARALEGVLSPLDLRNQNVRLSLVPTEPRGRRIVLSSTFEAPEKVALEASVSKVLGDRFALHEMARGEDLSRILLGS
jgi:hypothetical protein